MEKKPSIWDRKIEWKVIKLPTAGRAEMAESAIPRKPNFKMNFSRKRTKSS